MAGGGCWDTKVLLCSLNSFDLVMLRNVRLWARSQTVLRDIKALG